MSNFIGVSKNEIVWVQHIRDNFPVYLTTSDKNREVYYLYKYSKKDNKYIKMNHQSNDPIKLEEKHIKDIKYNKEDNNEIIKNKAILSNVIDSSGIEEMNKNNTNSNTNINTNIKRKRGRPKKEVTVSNPNINSTSLKPKPSKLKKGKLF